MLLCLILAWGLQGVAGVHADVLSPQSGQDSGLSLIQEEGLPKSVYDPAFVGSDETSGVLKRRKRDWTIPPIKMPENGRGPFPELLVQIKTSHSKDLNIVYSITGHGADHPPLNLFTIDAYIGTLYVTQPLDREKQDRYTLVSHAVAVGGTHAEEPMDIYIHVIDQNDNKPVFKQNPFLGSVSEAPKIGFEFMKVVATDADEPGNANSEIRYKILSQDPPLPNKNMFSINPVTGAIQVNAVNLDRKKIHEYILEIQAADLEGEGLTAYSKAIITITDSNDHAPQFDQTHYTASVSENVVGAVVMVLAAADGDEPNSPAWTTSYKIVAGDDQGMFSVSSVARKIDGIITIVKPLDFEKQREHLLLVTVENDIPFSSPLLTSTATVKVSVTDENEAPVFQPGEKIISISEDLTAGSEVVMYTATDPDTERKQTVWYEIGSDPAGWLMINKQTGQITVKSSMDRESDFVQHGKYTALILADDDDDLPATGTGTLIVKVKDVNDHPPTIRKTSITVCNQDPVPVLLPVLDGDGPRFSAPFSVELLDPYHDAWTAEMSTAGTGVMLKLKPSLLQRDFNVVLRVCDRGGLCANNTIFAQVNEENCVTRGSFCLVNP